MEKKTRGHDQLEKVGVPLGWLEKGLEIKRVTAVTKQGIHHSANSHPCAVIH